MALVRKQFRVVIGFNRVRYRVRVTGETCDEGTAEGNLRQSLMLKELADHPDLLRCGPSKWQQVTIKHNGTAWEAEAFAEVDEPTEG